MSKDTSITFARISISLASLCLALIAISIPSEDSTILTIPWPIRIGLSIAGAILLGSAALMMDWAVDQIPEDEWKKMDSKILELGDKKAFDPKRSFKARLKLYGGGYFFLSLGMSAITFAILWLVTIHITIHITTLNVALIFLYYFLLTLCSSAVFIKMMTKKLGTVGKTALIFGLLLVFSIGLNIYLLIN